MANNLNPSGRPLIFGVIVLAILAGVILFWPKQAEIFEFAGSAHTIEGNTIFASGFFSANGEPVAGQESEPVEIEISVDQDTKLTRLAIKIPQGVTSFNTDDLEKEETSTDFATIASDSMEHVLGIEAVLEKGSSDNKFIGRNLYFRVPVFSIPILNE